MRKFLVFGLFTLSFTFGGEVGNLIQFKAGTTAKSSEVNQNFNAIKQAVNDNNQRVGTVESFLNNLTSVCTPGQVVIGIGANGYPVCDVPPVETKEITIHSSECAPWRMKDTPDDAVRRGSLGVRPVADGEGSAVELICPINLPRGAKIKDIHILGKDSTTFYGLTVEFNKRSWNKDPSTNPELTTLASISTTNSENPGWFIKSVTNINETVQKGPETFYYLRVVFSDDMAGSNLFFTSATLVIEE